MSDDVKLCECGCGSEVRGRYVKGHNRRRTEFKHGTNTGYTYRKCRCDLCIDWQRAARKRRTKSKKSESQREAQREAQRKYSEKVGRKKADEFKRSKQVSTRQTASRHGYTWTGPELEIVARLDLTLTQAAEMLGRTYIAVSAKRHQLKEDPRVIALAGNQPDPTPGTVAFSEADSDLSSAYETGAGK